MPAPKGNDFWKKRKMHGGKITTAIMRYGIIEDAEVIEDEPSEDKKRGMTKEDIERELHEKFPPGEAERREREDRESEERQRDEESRRRIEMEHERERQAREDEQRREDEETREREEKKRKRRINLSQLISASLVLAILAHSLPIMYIGVRALLKKFMPEFALRKLSKEGYEFLMFSEDDMKQAGLEPLIEEIVEVYFLELSPWMVAVLTLGFTSAMKITMMHQDPDKEKYFAND